MYVERLRGIDPERLVFLDESGVSTQMTRRYGRAKRGVRVSESTPEGNWKILTILGAMSVRGLIATMTVEAATDAEIFLAYLDHVLCPALRPGDVVVMDNLSSHKVTGVRERIEAVGAEALYLPPYSPDLNPIEKHGQSSSSNSVPQRPERKKPSTKPSNNSSQPSAPRRKSMVQTAVHRLTSIANQI